MPYPARPAGRRCARWRSVGALETALLGRAAACFETSVQLSAMMREAISILLVILSTATPPRGAYFL